MLERHCACEIQSIDDLITQGNHSATVTLAFERALRQSGDAIHDTCFIFLMPDYLVADGSLGTVLRTIESGASAVLAGNFQIVAEDAAPLLRQRNDVVSHEIVLPPRDLLRWSLAHLHPATVANIVNFGLTHNAHINRLFWRVDANCLIGRFYLMHPIAIHPETSDFTVGSSCDYSFVPELCPSGNIAALTDSDDYLVVELQLRNYKSENLRPGPVVAAELAQSLAEWTTDNHRRNVAQTVVFHAADRPANLTQFIAQSEEFVESVRQLLTAPAIDHRRHPYWVGSIAVNRRRGHRALGKADWSFLLSEKTSHSTSSLDRVQAKLFGSPPEVTRLHPLWPDYELPLKALNDILSSHGRVLLLAHDAEPFAQWIVRAAGDVVTLNSDHLLQLTHVQYSELTGRFDACVLFSSDMILDQCDVLIEHIAPFLKSKGRLLLMATNSLSALDVGKFGRSFASQAGRLLNRSVWIEDIQYIELSPRRSAIRNAMIRLAEWSRRMPLLAAAALPVALANYFANVAARCSSTPPLGAWSSVYLTLRASEQAAPHPVRFAREAALARAGLAATQRTPVPNEGLQTPVGLPMLNLQITRLWHNDEARLASHLALYRFVAEVMGVRHDIAEYGCTCPAGTRLVLKQSRKLTLFDPRPLVIGDLQWRFQDEWRFQAQLHNIISTPLPRQVDSVYSINFLQHLSRDEEDIFVRNLREFAVAQFRLSAHRQSFVWCGSRQSAGPGARPERRHAACHDSIEPPGRSVPIDAAPNCAFGSTLAIRRSYCRQSAIRTRRSQDLSAHRRGAEGPYGAIFSKCILVLDGR